MTGEKSRDEMDLRYHQEAENLVLDLVEDVDQDHDLLIKTGHIPDLTRIGLQGLTQDLMTSIQEVVLGR